jgi:pimeloyl-ACP methyl ester carboxylesterase
LPNARRHHLPGAGHLPSIEHPEAINDLLRDFLSTRL